MKKIIFTLTLFLFLGKVVFGQVLFNEDFETDLDLWEYQKPGIAQIIKTNDLTHKSVLKLTPNKTSECVLIKDSDQWESIVIKGQALFPTDKHDYLGLVYNYHKATDRVDFGSIYVKGKGSYIRVNPHRDGNASRALYEEYKTALTGNEEIKVNQWFSFKAEIIGSECHFYVSDMEKPRVIFKYFEYSKGRIGFKPRLVGGEVWLDKITVEKIKDFSHLTSETLDEVAYLRERMINDWKALGPLRKRLEKVEKGTKNQSIIIDGQKFDWMDFSTDARGCLLAGKVSRFTTDERLVYFSTQIDSDKEIQTKIQFSSLNNLHVWVNSNYSGSIEKQKFAWFDFLKNSNHGSHNLPITLKEGSNRILVLVEGGNYSGDGFYSAIKI